MAAVDEGSWRRARGTPALGDTIDDAINARVHARPPRSGRGGLRHRGGPELPLLAGPARSRVRTPRAGLVRRLRALAANLGGTRRWPFRRASSGSRSAHAARSGLTSTRWRPGTGRHRRGGGAPRLPLFGPGPPDSVYAPGRTWAAGPRAQPAAPPGGPAQPHPGAWPSAAAETGVDPVESPGGWRRGSGAGHVVDLEVPLPAGGWRWPALRPHRPRGLLR